MERLRRHLGGIGLMWLLFQAATLAMAPYASCCDPAAQAAVDEDECCKGMAPGQMCPLHKHRQHQSQNGNGSSSHQQPADRCALRDTCAPGQQSLMTFGFGFAVLPAPVSLNVTFVPAAVPAFQGIPASQFRSLDLPPPRA